MININKYKKSSSISAKKKSSKNTTKQKETQTSFNEIINEKLSNTEETKEDLIETINGIDKYGELFLEKPNSNSLEDYKRYVKNFLNLVSKKIFRVQKIYAGNEYNILQTIDANLEELTMMILNNEYSKLELLEKIGEIRGLIIDIVGK